MADALQLRDAEAVHTLLLFVATLLVLVVTPRLRPQAADGLPCRKGRTG